MRTLSLRRADACVDCGTALPAGTQAQWDPATRTVHCNGCAAPSTAGASARREHDRRRTAREERIRGRHPRLGGVLLALSREPTSTRVWDQGAKGEEAVGAVLDALSDVIVLHDRSLPGRNGKPTRGNIDHLVVAGSGVWVIDAKTHYGPLEVRRSGGILSPRVERLFINNRDRTGLIDGLHRQVTSVEEVLATAGHDVPVRGALCFVGTTLPWVREQIGGVPLVGRRGLRELLQGDGELDGAVRAAVVGDLKARFRRA